MPRSADVELTVDTLFQMGVLSEEGCAKFAEFIRGLQALPVLRAAGNSGQTARRQVRRVARDPLKKFDPSEAELRGWYISQGMTVKEIASKHGISMPTVNDRLKRYGIKKRGKAAGATKKRRTKRKITKRKAGKRTKRRARNAG